MSIILTSNHTDNSSSSTSLAGTFPPTAVIIHKSVPEEVCRLASDQSIIVEDGTMIPLDYVVREGGVTTTTMGSTSAHLSSHELNRKTSHQEVRKISNVDLISIDDATSAVSKWLSGTFSLACSRFHVLVVGGSQSHHVGTDEQSPEEQELSASLRTARQRDHTEFDCLTHSICPGFQNDTILPQQLSRHQRLGAGPNSDLPMRIVSYFDTEHAYREYCFWNCDVLFDEREKTAETGSPSSSSSSSISCLPSPERLSSILSMSVSLGFAAVIWYPPRDEKHSEEFARTACQLVEWKKQFVQGMQQTMANRPQHLLGLLARDECHLLLRDMIVSHRLTLSYPHEMLPFIDEAIEKLAPSEDDGDSSDKSGSSLLASRSPSAQQEQQVDLLNDGQNNNNLKKNKPTKVGLVGNLENENDDDENGKNDDNGQKTSAATVPPPLSNTLLSISSSVIANNNHHQNNNKVTSSPTVATPSASSLSARAILKQELDRLQAENLELRTQFNPVRMKLDLLERENAQLRLDSTRTEKSSKVILSENEQLHAQLRTLEEEREGETRKLQRSRDEMEREIRALKNEMIEERAKSKLELEQTLMQLQSKTSQQQQQPKKDEKNDNDSVLIINDLKIQVEKLDRELLEAERQNALLQQQLNNLNNSNSQQQQQQRMQRTMSTTSATSSRPSTPNNNNNNNNNLSSSGSNLFNSTTSVLIQSIRDQEKTKTDRVTREFDQYRRESETRTVELKRRVKALEDEVSESAKTIQEMKDRHKTETDQLWKQAHENEVKLTSNSENQRRELQAQIHQLQAESALWHQQFVQEKMSLEQSLLDQNEKEQHKLREEFDSSINKLSQDKETLQQQLLTAKQNITLLQEERASLLQQVDSQKQQISSIESEKDRLQEEKEHATTVLNERHEIESSAREAEIKLQEAAKLLDSLRSDLEEEKSLSELWKKKHDALQNQFEKDQDESMKEARERIDKLVTDNQSLTTELAEKQQQLEKLQSDLAESEEKRVNLKNAHKTTCSALAETERRKAEIEQESARAAAKMQDLETFRTVRELEQKLTASQTELVRLRETSAAALSELEMERRTNARLSLELAKIDKEMLRRSVETSEKIPSLLAELRRVKRVANEMALQVETLKDENEENSTMMMMTAPTPPTSTAVVYEETREALRQSEAQNLKLTQELQILHLQVTNLIDRVGTDAQKEAIRVAESAKLRATINRFVQDQSRDAAGGELSNEINNNTSTIDENDSTPITRKIQDQDQNQNNSLVVNIAKRGEELLLFNNNTNNNNSTSSSATLQKPPLSPPANVIISNNNNHKRSATSPPSPGSPNSARKKLLIDAMEYQRRELEWQRELQKLKEENILLANEMLEKKAKQKEVASLALIWNSGKKDQQQQQQQQVSRQQQQQQHNSSSSSSNLLTNRRLELPPDSVLIEALDRHTHLQNMKLNEGRLAQEHNTNSNNSKNNFSVSGAVVRNIYL